jgi:streptogramin lyase
VDIAIGPAGDVYVVDDQRDDIQRFAPDGTHKATIGKHGTAPGELNYAASIDVGPTGALVQADWDNSRIQAWDDQGNSIWSFGSGGSGPGTFTNPNDVSVDHDGRVYASDLGRVQVLDAAQHLIGEANLPGVDVSYLANDGTFLYVTKPFTDEILKLRLLP